ncbi:MAG TPA: hypothetical protein VM238_05460 [Phycisphaerae bacterium]|nr:hypothetical protein [Phycisphaerae bacterium]
MSIRSTWQNSSLLGKDGFCRCVYSAATFAPLQYMAFTDFVPAPIKDADEMPGWTVTLSGGGEGSLVMADEAGGILQLTPAAAEDQGIQIQTDGEMFLPAATKDIWFEARIRGNDVTQVDWFAGLCTTDTSIIASNPDNAIGFWTHDGDANLDFEVADGTGAPVDTTVDLADNTWINVGFLVNGVTSVTPYINGVAYTAVTANIPATELALSFAVLSGEGAANRLDIDWVRCTQLR